MRIELTQNQEAYLVKHFKHTHNAKLVEYLGISESTLHRMARKLGLKKSKQFMRKCQAATAAAAKISHLAFNTYPPKGYRIPGSEKHQFLPGHSMKEKIGEERWQRAKMKARETRRETFRKERARAIFGLPQKTKLRVKQQPRQKVLDRSYLKRRGYIIDETEVIAYWTPDTRRATRLESRPRRYYRFEKYQG